ncbi:MULTISPECIES: glycosyltransferase [Coprobacillaceae]|uniref:glycosyltransferase n=1 Tax=Coprobacillaceae TaxID=2810280 RepID=UPI000E54D9F4|nr:MULTISPECIES: glycosyltransferase [Coprobacillaceae]RHM59398.1 glycosyltransferase [Coprobacillus sp. AF33-1AC]RHS91755.1 glycosyltransferase [Erysipelatoclostridium sp. AM42-17]
MPKISVIMSTYKEQEIFLRKAIESILNQSYEDFEYIIILDNPQNKEHKRIINEYANNDDRIRFFVNEQNMGLTASLNKGIKYATGEFICRMDADDISKYDRIEKQLLYLIQNNYDLIGGITQMIDENDKPIYSIKSIPTDFNKIKKIIKYNQCLAHPTWIGKKELFIELDGYRNIPLCEDYDFTLRAILKGYKVSNLNETVLQYRMTNNSLSRNNLLEQFLYAEFITNAYSNGHVANIEKAKKYVDKNNNVKKATRYSKANKIFNDAINQLEKRNYILFILKGISIPFVSLTFLKKIYRFFMVQINSASR